MFGKSADKKSDAEIATIIFQWTDTEAAIAESTLFFESVAYRLQRADGGPFTEADLDKLDQ